MTLGHGDADVAQEPGKNAANTKDSVLDAIIARVVDRLRDSDEFDEVHIRDIKDLLSSGRVTSSNGLQPILSREATITK